MKNLQAFINYIGSTRAKQRRNIMLTATLSVLVLFLVSILLTKPADSMSGKLICGTEIHMHSDACRRLECTYEQTLPSETVAEAEEIPETDAFMQEIPSETAEPTEAHVHGAECYELMCELEEHEHSQDCYEQEETMLMSTLFGGGIDLMADEETDVAEQSAENEWFESPPTALPESCMNVFYNVVNSADYPTTLTQGNPVDDNKQVKVQLSFQLGNNEITSIVNDGQNFNNYLYYKLPDGMTFLEESCGSDCRAYDSSSGTKKLSSYYTFTNSINGESYIVFRIVDDYICSDFLTEDGDVKATVFNCKIEFDAVVSRNPERNDGTRNVILSNTVNTDVTFNEYKAYMYKDGARKTSEDGKSSYAEWTITVNNKAPQTKLTNGYYITDDMLANMKEGSFKVVPEGAAELQTVDNGDGTSSKKIIFKQEASAENNYDIKITYQTDIDKELFYSDAGRNIKNTASMTDGTLDKPLTDDAEVYVPPIANIYKYGDRDYKTAVSPKVGNELVWTIQLSTELNEPLGGYAVIDDKITASMKELTVTDFQDNVIPAEKYTLSDGMITFADDLEATSLKIIYKASKDITTNTAQVVYPPEQSTEPGPSYNATVYGEYKPYTLDKTGSIKDGKEEWTIEVKPNDGNATSIYGMIIHDEVFERISQINGAKDITVTATTDGWWDEAGIDFDWVDNTTIKLKKPEGSDAPDAKAIKIVFRADIDPNSPNGQAIAAAQPAKFTNKFHINMNDYTDEFEKSFDYNPANTLSKKRISPTSNEIELWKKEDGFTTKELQWQVDMEQGTGFTGDSKLFVDVIQAIDKATNAESSQAQHYIAPGQRGVLTSDMTDEQLKDITIKAKVKSTDEWVEITNTDEKTYYNISFFTDTAASSPAFDTDNAKSFTITFDDTNFVSENGERYTFVTMTYSTTMDMTNVTDPAMITFNNEAKFNNKTESSEYKVEVYDPQNPSYTKNLVDPVTYEAITEETLNLADVKKITENGISYYLFAWKIDFEKHVWEDTSFGFVDTFNEGFTLCTSGLYAPKCVEKWGDSYKEMANYNDWNCYLYSEGDNVVKFPAVGTIKCILYFTKIPVSEFKETVLEKVDNGDTYLLSNSLVDTSNKYGYEPVSDSVNITAEHDPILPDTGDIDKQYIPNTDPQYNGDAISGTGDNTIEYAIDINSGALDLSNSDNVILKDIFATKSYTHKDEWGVNDVTETGNSLVNTILNNVKVYEVDSNGNKTVLPESEYSYQYDGEVVEYYPVEVSTSKQYQYGVDGNNYYNEWYFGKDIGEWDANKQFPLESGDIVTITIKYNVNGHYCDSSQLYVKPDGTNDHNYDKIQFNFTGANNQTQNNVMNLSEPTRYDANGYATYTITVPEGYTSLTVKNDPHGFEEVTATVQRKITSTELSLILPDAKHLRVEYAYTLFDPDTAQRPAKGSKLVFSNTATLIANGTVSDTTDEATLEFLYDVAETSVAYKPRINKLDVADQTIKGLDATFNFGKYDKDTGVWKWYTQQLQSDAQVDMGSWGSADEAQSITTVNGEFKFGGLESGVIYVLEEIVAPVHDKYQYESVDKIKPYYFTYTSYPDSYPMGIDSEALSKDNVKFIRSGSIIPVTNNRIIDVNVTKRWTDSEMEDADITVQLYWSYTKALSGFPDVMTEAKSSDLGVEVESVQRFKDSYTWSGLPNGIDGKPIYYYVKELGYTKDGTSYAVSDEIAYNSILDAEFLPFYTGNGVNSSEQTIEITNADALRVEKLWHDNQNNPLPSSYLPQSIDFKIYARVKETDKETLIINPDNGSDIFTITADNNWVYEIPPELINSYSYFRVEEVNKLDGYVVSYNSNYQGPTGIITIINKNTEVENPTTQITVEKTWHDGDGTNRPQSLDITLKSSRDKTAWTNVEGVQPILTTSGDNNSIWTYTYSDLPYRDASGNVLYYMIEENVPSGYVCSYDNNDGIDSGTIKLTNTKVIDLTINKQWSDINRNDHNDDTVKVTVYRSTKQSDVTKKNDSAYKYEELEIKKSDSWTKTLKDLEAYDADGNPYYYWVVENEADFTGAYNASYTYSGTAADSVVGESGMVTINNEYIYPPAELPSTGGPGTIIYYILGAVIGLTGLALFINLRQYMIKKY